MRYRYLINVLLITGAVLSPIGSVTLAELLAGDTPATVTILCYMNGDNDLAQEVLHALDMMETVGSSDLVNVIALVDGHQRWLGPYDDKWSQTRLLHLIADPTIGRITSPVLAEWGEANMGDPITLTRFVRTALARFPADRYLFYIFAHGQGVLDTRTLMLPLPTKTVSLSRDDTSGRQMRVDEFHQALKQGLDGHRFEMMVLFSCLANMAEVAYTLSDLTEYIVGSQDEIRLVNQPPGQYQIRGLRFEKLIAELNEAPTANLRKLGRTLVDSHVDNYEQEVRLSSYDGTYQTCQYSGNMALLDATYMPPLASALDQLAWQLIGHADNPDVIRSMRSALSSTQPFASFLNLEYYDLQGFVHHLQQTLRQTELIAICDRIVSLLTEHVLVYSRQTGNCAATGLSIYLSHPLVPSNIFTTHQFLYRNNRFSRDTQWDEMIDVFRHPLKSAPP